MVVDRSDLVLAAASAAKAVLMLKSASPPDESELALLTGDVHCLSRHIAAILTWLARQYSAQGAATVQQDDAANTARTLTVLLDDAMREVLLDGTPDGTGGQGDGES